MKIAVVGHFTYFENHFPENWRIRSDVLCFNVSESDYSWLIAVANYRPDVTIFYRPELYPKYLLDLIPGYKVGVLSEPLPTYDKNGLVYTEETRLRELVYRSMSWDSFDWITYYDKGKSESATYLGYKINEYRPLPIDSSVFNSCFDTLHNKEFDVVFLGKPTSHRIKALDSLRLSKYKFAWVAHGYSGVRLANFFRNSKLVLNIHADAKPAFEPRLYLAAACGAVVITEELNVDPEHFVDRIFQTSFPITDDYISQFINLSTQSLGEDHNASIKALSFNSFIETIKNKFL